MLEEKSQKHLPLLITRRMDGWFTVDARSSKMTLQPKRVRDSHTVISRWMQWTDANPVGNVQVSVSRVICRSQTREGAGEWLDFANWLSLTLSR
jgi:hypothetical protein